VIVLIDTDILVDVALDRAPFADASSALLDRLERLPGSGFVAWHSLSNLYYLVSPGVGKSSTKDFLVDLLGFTQVAPTTTESFMAAARLPMTDLEDAMQVAAALACKAEVIATRNLDDFKRSPVPARSPGAVLDELRRA
jgi:predicted nucleic acid-binding protein